MRRIVQLLRRCGAFLVPSRYRGRFDRLSEDNQRTVAANHVRSGF